MVKKPEFTPTISFGNLLQICLTVGTIAVGWGYMHSKVDNMQVLHATSITRMTQEIQKSERESNALAARIRELEAQSARTDERFTMILTLMSSMKNDINKLTSN